jgi:hypothetical protein
MAAAVGIFLILIGLACWVKVYAILRSSNDPEDLGNRYDSSVNEFARKAAVAAYFLVGLVGIAFGISLL